MAKKQKIPPKTPPEAKTPPEQKSKGSEKKHLLSWAVFVGTFAIVLLFLIPVIFPALIIRATSPFQSEGYQPNVVDPYQTGVLAGPFLAVSFAVLAIGVGYYKKSLWKNWIHSITTFELSKKQAVIAGIIILAIFCAATVGTIGQEENWTDYQNVKKRVDSWTLSQFGKSFEPHMKYLLLSISLNGLGNIRIIPFILSMALLVQVYFFTRDITGKRFAGIVSMVLVLQSYVFVNYSTTASYDNSWILLFLFSVYIIQKFWPPSPVPFFLSIFAKALTVAFLPATLYFIARSNLAKRSKIYSLGTYGVIIVIILVAAASYGSSFTGGAITFDGSLFWQGFEAMAMQMRFDYVVVLFVLPLTVMLFFQSRKGILHADSMMIFILVILLTSPFLTGFTTQTNQPYRFVSLVVFFAIGAGVLLSNKTRIQPVVSSST